MLTINLEDGSEAHSKASMFKNELYRFFGYNFIKQ